MESMLANQMARFVILAIALINGFLLIGDFGKGYGAVVYVVLALLIGAFIFLCYAMFIQVEEEISIMFIIGTVLLIAAILLSSYSTIMDLNGVALTSKLLLLPLVPKVAHTIFVLMSFFVLRRPDDLLHFTWKLSMIFVFLSILSTLIALVLQRSMCSAETKFTICHLAFTLLQQFLSNFLGAIAIILFLIGLVFNKLFEPGEPSF